jgi:hypothetical protein
LAHAESFSVSTEVLDGGVAGPGNVGPQSSATNEINYVQFIPNGANPATVQYDNAGHTVNLAPNIYAAGAARGATQGIQVNTYGPEGGSIPNTTNMFLAGQPDVNNQGFGAHANWVVTLNLDAIRANLFGGTTGTIYLSGQFGPWGAIGDPTTTGGNVQGEIFLNGVRADSMSQASFSPVNDPTFNLQITSADHELSFFILNSPTSSNWDDGIFENVTLSTPEPSSIVALCGAGALGLFIAVRRRRKS